MAFPKLRIVVGACGTKFGKTYGCTIRLLKEAWENKDSENWWVAPTYAQATNAYDLILRMLPTELVQEAKAEMTLYILDPEGNRRSKIVFKSGDSPDSLRGYGVNFFILDEAARVPYASWVSLVTTITQTFAKGIVISTPKGHNWFFDEYQKGEKFLDDGVTPKFLEGEEDPNPEYMSIRMPTWANPTVKSESIDFMQKNLPVDVFEQEVEAKFLLESAGVFRNIRGCIKGQDIEEPIPGHNYVLGVDLARLRDYSVLVVMDRTRRHVVYMERFNQIAWEVQYQRIISCAKKYNNAVVSIDWTGIGDPIVETLRGGGLVMEPYKIGGSTAKQQLIEKLRVALENGRVSYPFNKDKPQPTIVRLMHEMERYEYVIGPTGVVKYSAPNGEHDDCVIAMALATWVADQEVWKYKAYSRRGV